MSNQQSPLFWSFAIGNWFMTQVRVSFFFPLLVALFLWKFGLPIGGTLSAILFASVLLHEFGHVMVARYTGGIGDEILIWPLGGLAFVQPGPSNWARFQTAAAGPLTNLILCGITLWAVVRSPYTAETLNPLVLPFSDFSPQVVQDVLVLVFAVNWAILLLNLIPVFPLDGGRMLQACLAGRLGNDTATEVYLRVGFVFAFGMLIGGLMFDKSWVVGIGAIVLVLNMAESFQHRAGESYDESFMGYDFSQGYTSLERSQSSVREQRKSFYQAWRERRQAEKQRREIERAEEEERQLDALLEKVHTQGFESLSETEKRLLNRASDRYRNKGKPTGQA